MDVQALLPRPLLRHLEHVLGPEHSVFAATDWGDLEASIRRRIVDLIVADPSVAGNDAVGTLERVRRDFPSLPVVIYTPLTASTLSAVVRLARSGVEHVVLHRFDDEPRRLKKLLEGMPGRTLGQRMLHLLAEPIALLPITVARAIETLFVTPEQFRSTQDLARAAGMNTRTLYRNLEPVGFHSVRTLMVAARLIEVFTYLRDPGRSIKDVASKAGFPSPYQLNRYVREMTGLTTEDARRRLGGEELLAMLAHQVRRKKGA